MSIVAKRFVHWKLKTIWINCTWKLVTTLSKQCWGNSWFYIEYKCHTFHSVKTVVNLLLFKLATWVTIKQISSQIETTFLTQTHLCTRSYAKVKWLHIHKLIGISANNRRLSNGGRLESLTDKKGILKQLYINANRHALCVEKLELIFIFHVCVCLSHNCFESTFNLV